MRTRPTRCSVRAIPWRSRARFWRICVADAVGNLQEPLGRLANWDRLRPSELCRRRWCITLTDVGTMLEACLAGYGIAQVMGFGIADLLEKGRLVELFPDWHDE